MSWESKKIEAVGRAKEELLRSTDIESYPAEMEMLDTFLNRAWQMGWLKTEEAPYIVRLRKEYRQLKTKHKKLEDTCIKYAAGTLEFQPNSTIELLKKQMEAMEVYLRCLEERAMQEGIKL